jgi:hypothetical protein
MALMVVAILLFITLGLFASRFGPREHLLIGLLAVLMSALYLAVERLM